MRTREQADCIAKGVLASIQANAGVDLVLLPDIFDHPKAWVYFFESRVYFNTGDVDHALAGNGPIVVPKSDRAAWIASSDADVAEQIE